MRMFLILLLPLLLVPPLATAAEPAREPDSLTSAEGEKLFQESLRKVCAGVMASKNLQQPFASDCGPWPGMQVPAASMLGLVLLGEGNTLSKGPHAATLRKLTTYVRSAGPNPHESIDNYRTWVLSFSLVFLSEIHRITPSHELKKTLEEMATKLEAGAYETGGWGHTLDHERNKYGAFVAVSIWAAAGLTAAKGQGVEVDAKKLERQYGWLRKSLNNAAGGSYYTSNSRTLISPGRTAGVIWLLHRWDKTASAKQIELGSAFILRHIALTPEGHASGMMNFAWGALAAGEIGEPLAKEFWTVHTKSIKTARRGDGAFATQVWRDISFHESKDTDALEQKQVTPTADETAGDNWAAVWMLTAWQSARGKSLLTGQAAKPDAKGKSTGDKAPSP